MTDNNDRRLKLAVSMWPAGRHSSSWLDPDAQLDGEMNPDFYRHVAQTAERGVFDYFFLGNSQESVIGDGTVNPFHTFKPDTFTAAQYVAAVTSHIGVVATINATYSHPYDVARQAATLDYFSRGRAGLNIITGADGGNAIAQNYGRENHPTGAQRYEVTNELFEVVRDLWDSWSDDWLVGDRNTARFLDASKSRPINHHGKYFSVTGPLNIPRPPQGHLPIVHAGHSKASYEFGAKYGDVRFTYFRDTAWNTKLYADVKAQVAAQGRDPNQHTIITGINFYVRETLSEAKAYFEASQRRLPYPYDAKYLSETLKFDVAAFAPQDKVRDVLHGHSFGETDYVIQRAYETYWRDDITLEELFRLERNDPSFVATVVGSGKEVADWLERNFHARAFDAIKVFPNALPSSINSFVDWVVPELQRRGIARKTYDTTTLREHLSLDSAPNRFDRLQQRIA
jgi:FMN-dependent oxidoreductase (nitrilotriacetate monooxygenase family)